MIITISQIYKDYEIPYDWLHKPYLEMDLSISSLAEDKIWVGIKIAA